MIQTQATLIKKESIAPAWWCFTLSAPALSPRPQPGQFLLCRCAAGPGATPYLRRPLFPAQIEANQLSFLIRPSPDPGLAWLTARKIGDTLNLIGPLGRGFPLAPNLRHLLLVSDSPAIGPLLGYMTQALAANRSVTLALGGSRAAALYPVSKLPPAVEYQAATLDGSLGHRGPVTNLLPPLLRWADAVCAVGSPALYQSLKQQTETVRLRLEPGFLFGLQSHKPLLCGVGACLACSVDTQTGLKLACLDGPVFDLAL